MHTCACQKNSIKQYINNIKKSQNQVDIYCVVILSKSERKLQKQLFKSLVVRQYGLNIKTQRDNCKEVIKGSIW